MSHICCCIAQLSWTDSIVGRHLSWCVSVRLCVNQGGLNHNRWTQRFGILHGDPTPAPNSIQPNISHDIDSSKMVTLLIQTLTWANTKCWENGAVFRWRGVACSNRSAIVPNNHALRQWLDGCWANCTECTRSLQRCSAVVWGLIWSLFCDNLGNAK